MQQKNTKILKWKVTHHLHCAISLNGEQWGTFFCIWHKKSQCTGSPDGEKTAKHALGGIIKELSNGSNDCF